MWNGFPYQTCVRKGRIFLPECGCASACRLSTIEWHSILLTTCLAASTAKNGCAGTESFFMSKSTNRNSYRMCNRLVQSENFLAILRNGTIFAYVRERAQFIIYFLFNNRENTPNVIAFKIDGEKNHSNSKNMRGATIENERLLCWSCCCCSDYGCSPFESWDDQVNERNSCRMWVERVEHFPDELWAKKNQNPFVYLRSIEHWHFSLDEAAALAPVTLFVLSPIEFLLSTLLIERNDKHWSICNE